MALIEFENLPNTTTPLKAENLNNNFNEVKKSDIITNGEIVKCGYKIDGKDVYVKRINVGKLPNNSEITLDIGINSTTAQIVDINVCTTGNYQQKIPNNATYSLLTPTGLVIGTSVNYSDYNAIATIEFIYNSAKGVEIDGNDN